MQSKIDLFSPIRNRLNMYGWQGEETPTPAGFTCASVAIPLHRKGNKLQILFTKRTTTVRDHQGQISFPGGACETGDASNLDTAIRETREEIGIQINFEAVLGALAPRKTVTGYFITPYVVKLHSLERLRINTAEVEKVITVPLDWLVEPANYSIRPFERPGVEQHEVIFYTDFEGEIIWGITAEILHDFFAAIKK